ncbi:MAG TPA: sigma-70 family RNA polymerase sigma factor [Solirubrobacterales bacterium]|nr:sigma-70 family RNA polymerase sigma factor [Solirubrobacterales bacterium]
MTTQEAVLARAREGDEEAFGALTDPYRRELQIHCYRILGSLQDAEDAVQETLLSAWRGLAGFEARASLRSWLYRIATNRCLNMLRNSDRRERPMLGDGITDAPEPSRRAEPIWLQPFPDELLEGLPDRAPGPDARYETKEAVGLAFVSGLQRMPPQQRAVVVLRDVLGYRAAEVAAMLETSEASVNSALQRARAALDAAPERPVGGTVPDSPAQRRLLGRFAEAFEATDVDAILGLLREDAWIRMPPEPHEYTGRDAIGEFLRTRPLWREGGRVQLIPTRANGQPAFAYYMGDPQADVCRISGIFVMTLADDGITAITRFGEGGWLPWFGLPRTLPG